MILFYTLGIKIYYVLIWIFSFFNEKADLFVRGRKNIFEQIANKIDSSEKHIWFHFASLGEFEQGRPVLEKMKTDYPDKKIVVTFFSPSGFEIRKNYALADAVFYLPVDSKKNAKRFLTSINPEIAIFTKYEFWYFYFAALKENSIPLYVISGIFRKNQLFFKWYGTFYRKILKCVTHFFVQNTESEDLLKSIKFNNVTRSGDTRFDRVYENANSTKALIEIEQFVGNSPVLVAGSTWLADEEILSALPGRYPDWKFIIAPHEIDDKHISALEKLFPNNVKYSNLQSTIPNLRHSVLIIDNIGMLSSLYQYGKLAYIGGGFGAGIHNTLEAVAFGLPVIFGPRYDKFQEAKDLIAIGVAKSVNSKDELHHAFENLKGNEKATDDAKNYVKNKKGATEIILSAISF